MPFGLAIGTERAATLQNAIQNELTKRGYSPDADPVMSEYITIMIINNKTAAQVTSELEDLIGQEYDPSFTDWLFAEAAKGAPDSETPSQPQASTSIQPPSQPSATREVPPHPPSDATPRRPPNAPRGTTVYQQALNQALPSTSPSAQKRTASARSPSPSSQGPNKSRRTEVPTGPRAMFRGDGSSSGSHSGPRSLLDRVGGPAARASSGGFSHSDDIQARIDNITNNSPDPNMMMPAFANGGMPIDMNMAMGMGNPMMLQEMMMNQMAMMAQMASSMGMINPATGQFIGGGGVPGGLPMPGDLGMFPAGMNGFQVSPPPPQQHMGGGRGRGSGRGGRGMGRGRGGLPSANGVGAGPAEPSAHVLEPQLVVAPIAAPIPTPAAPAEGTLSTAAALSASTTAQARTGFVAPERPQSPTLCKYSLKCTNAHCRYSHPSPVATAESGVVLSNEACEKGKDCKDKDCIKAHVSPAVLNPASAELHKPNGHVTPASIATAPPHSQNTVPCRFGAACTRPNCPYTHPPVHKTTNHFAQQCRFGAGCTRASCPFQHPEGRVLPTTFHRGLSTTAPIVNVQTPEAGSMSGTSHNRSMTFNKDGSSKERLEKKMKELEEKKSQAEKEMKNAEATAGKKDETTQLAITA